MLQTPSDFRLQAALLILCICSICIGLLSFTVGTLAVPGIPERLIVTPSVAPVVMVGGFALLALAYERKKSRILAGGVLATIGSYGVLCHLGGFGTVSGKLRDVHLFLALTPSLAVLVMAVVCFTGLRSRGGRRIGIVAGCTGVMAGITVLLRYVQQDSNDLVDELVGGVSEMAGVLCLAFGGMLLTLVHRQRTIRLRPQRQTFLVGSLGVVGTFLLFLMANWGVHMDRHQSAQLMLKHYASTLEHGLHSHVQLLERAAERLLSLHSGSQGNSLQGQAQTYFQDTPALNALAILTAGGGILWQSAKTERDLRWVTEHGIRPEVLSGLSEAGRDPLRKNWFFPDAENPLSALVFVTVGNRSHDYFVASLNLQALLDYEVPDRDAQFSVMILPPGHSAMSVSDAGASGVPEIFESEKINLGRGEGLTLVARAGPPDLLSFQGFFPIVLLGFGLVMSYLLIMGRSLLGAYRAQARELSVAEQQFRSLFSQSPDAVFAVDERGYYRSLNSMAERIVKLGIDDVGTTHFRDVLDAGQMSQQDRERFESAFRNAASGQTQSFEISFTSPDGSESRDYEADMLPVLVDGTVSGVFIIGKDITERLKAQDSERILKRSLESSDTGVIVVDHRTADLPVVFVNPAFCQMTGYSESELLGATVKLLAGPETDRKDIELIDRATQAGQPLSLTMKSYRKDGTPFWNQVSLAPVTDDHREVTHYTAITRDISERKEQEGRLAYQATHDALTGLGNRALFEDRLEHDFSLAKRYGKLLAVLFIDLDEFKPINDTLGHKIGDQLLISVAVRLKRILRPTDTLVRFGGDEFVLVLPNLGHAREAEEVAERILGELSKPHVVGRHELHVSASIGISLLADGMEYSERLLQQADMAMYKAKQQGRDTYEVYSPDLDDSLSKRVVLRNDLQEALKTNQLFVHYQPQVNLHGILCGLEALVRWKHPTKGYISPAEFIPVAEETGQIIQIGKWVTAQACKDARYLVERGLLKGRMAVNLSPMQFHRPNFLTTVQEILEETGLSSEFLELELTEGILMKDTESAIRILNALADLGIATAIDDFGTGFSSFGYLRDLPVDKIKIDRSFVSQIATSEKDAAVCKGVISLTRDMGLKVLAEGVETKEQATILSDYGCAVFQGYYFAKPMALKELTFWLTDARDEDRDLGAQGAPLGSTIKGF
ncbi:EAL and GGDEF domain-containing protein [Marinobacter santoriniensis NKSG1]|uniref:cyclic-guanylate-specific phosphodiesterase n=2 Tax=Marinobacter santoriniensis TaxID=523742 RepID=M7CSY0_9GAMM|nr:EAL and GGDEF domain-containing protein [Marinobacter santoriniensis NKSG1]